MRGEIDNLTVLLEKALHGPAGAWVVLDLDETLLTTQGYFGSETWYEKLIENHCLRGVDVKTASGLANAEWEKAHATLEMLPTEPEVLPMLQDWNGTLLGLTCRRGEFAGRTREQLSIAGYPFFAPAGIADRDLGVFGHYKGGVLYVGPVGNKGRSLGHFLDDTA